MRVILGSVLCIGLVTSGCSDGDASLQKSNNSADELEQKDSGREAQHAQWREIIRKSRKMGEATRVCLDDKFERFDDGSDVFKLASMFYVMCRNEIRAIIPHVSRDARYKYELPYQTVEIASELVRHRDQQ